MVNLIKVLGLHRNDPIWDQMNSEKLEIIIDTKLRNRIIEELPPETIKDMVALYESDKLDLKKWLTKNLPNYEEIFREEIDRYIEHFNSRLSDKIRVYDNLKKAENNG